MFYTYSGPMEVLDDIWKWNRDVEIIWFYVDNSTLTCPLCHCTATATAVSDLTMKFVRVLAFIRKT